MVIVRKGIYDRLIIHRRVCNQLSRGLKETSS